MSNVKMKRSSEREGIKLFWITAPLLLLVLLFNYIPLLGWVYSFFDYKPGLALKDCAFVGFKYFLLPFQNPVTRSDTLRVLKNTVGMALIGYATCLLPMLFAVFLAQLGSNRYRKIVQTITTLPNFISWILVYALAYSMFSTDSGFVNNVAKMIDSNWSSVNFLASADHMWLKMWAYGTWKSLGWTAIIYIASLSSIDAGLYEAASIDGAGRFQKMWYVTIPGLLPTFFVLLVMNIANFLNTGYEQYYIFQNAMNKSTIEVLDLFVYNQGVLGHNISYATAVGMLKSLISLMLFFSANRISKKIRGESIF